MGTLAHDLNSIIRKDDFEARRLKFEVEETSTGKKENTANVKYGLPPSFFTRIPASGQISPDGFLTKKYHPPALNAGDQAP